MKKHIIIVGNGFDLAHNLKTSYYHFTQSIIRGYINDSTLHNEILNIPKVLKLSTEDPIERLKIGDGHIRNSIFRKFYKEGVKGNWSDIEGLYFSMLKTTSNANELNSEFGVLKGKLSEYLNKEIESQKNFKRIKSYNYLFNELLNDSLVINFNYTPICSYYVEDEERLINIHGKMNQEVDKMTFGYNAIDEEMQPLLDRNIDELLLNIKRFDYDRGANLDVIKKRLSNRVKKNLFIIGHSCGLSDRWLLEQIFSSSLIDKIYIFYYKTFEEYKKSKFSIMRITGIGSTEKKVVGFNDCCEAPQHTDTEIDFETFKKKLDKIINGS